VFLEGKNAELPVECLHLRPWDIIVAEDSFALMTMSTQAKCFYADSFFASFRSKEELDRTKFHKEFSLLENLDLKDLPLLP
jgi:hypothetical protein